ncbi:Uncharacterized protein K02A2.6 [Eumeta japonica]|uniref:Uncharacterized protein K02A2.6 n=1 Tax=Eumeta variegata TaxID=151549 RepID=A0A4C1VRT2_EUMVA|nr:Uncharacterized protein K02A2.6 [Eumeta japonica]
MMAVGAQVHTRRYCNFQVTEHHAQRQIYPRSAGCREERLFTEDAGKDNVQRWSWSSPLQCARAAAQTPSAEIVAAQSSVGGVFALRRQPVDKVRHWRARRAAGGDARSTPRRAVKYFQCSGVSCVGMRITIKECRFANYKCNKREKRGHLRRMCGEEGDVRALLFGSGLAEILKSDGTVRVCGDYSVTLNKVLHIDRYPLPRIEELFARLHEGKEFSKLDLSMAYMQLELTEDSQPLTCINTHRGLSNLRDWFWVIVGACDISKQWNEFWPA